jgi:Domain of unknown function (DUF4266)
MTFARKARRGTLRPIAALLGCGLLAVSAACANVAPYQRETLSRPDMALDAQSELLSAEEHARSYREGSSGAGRARGGGCGCN